MGASRDVRKYTEEERQRATELGIPKGTLSYWAFAARKQSPVPSPQQTAIPASTPGHDPKAKAVSGVAKVYTCCFPRRSVMVESD